MTSLERKILIADRNPELRTAIQNVLYSRFGNNLLQVEQAETSIAFGSKYGSSVDIAIIGSGFNELDMPKVVENFSGTHSYRPCIFLSSHEDISRYPALSRQFTGNVRVLTKPSHNITDLTRGFYTALTDHVFDFLTGQQKLEQTGAIGIIGVGRVGTAFALDHLKSSSLVKHILLANTSPDNERRHRGYIAQQAKDSLESVLQTGEVPPHNKDCRIHLADYHQINFLCRDIFICLSASSQRESELVEREKFLDVNFDEIAFAVAPHFTNGNANYYIVTNPSDLMALTFDIYTSRRISDGKTKRLKIEAVGIDMQHKRGLAWMDHIARSDKQMFDPSYEIKPTLDLVLAGPHSEHFVVVNDTIKGSSLDYWGRALSRDDIHRGALIEEINRRGRGNYTLTDGNIVGGEASAVLLDHLRSKYDPQSIIFGSLLVDLLEFSDLGAGFYEIPGNGGSRKKGDSIISEKFPHGMYTGWKMKHEPFFKRPVPLSLELKETETRHQLFAALLRDRQHYLAYVKHRLRETRDPKYQQAIDFFTSS